MVSKRRQFLSDYPELNEPIDGHGMTFEDIESVRRERLELLRHEMLVLADAADSWREAFYWLARETVPGLMTTVEMEKFGLAPPRHAGRPREWDGPRGYILLRRIDQICTERGRGIRDAIRTIKKKYPAIYRSWSARTIETRYHELRRKSKTDVR
jgi:hypothetical protein